MNQVSVDTATRRAKVQGGAVWSEVDGPAQAHGLAVTGGHITHTGVAGLTLGGGVGHLMRKLGLVIEVAPVPHAVRDDVHPRSDCELLRFERIRMHH